jgi:prepilin-type N-terminal cleavage/methylation domain-containing protein
MKHLKAFTLIELLVVIAIIGLLATIIGVNVNSARNKANTAKSIQFSDNIYHSMGDNCVAYYDFNDTADGTLKDISGNNNTGTIHGAVSTTSLTYSGGNLGNALYFDGVDDYVTFGVAPTFNFTDNFTVTAWVKLLTNGKTSQYHRILGQDYYSASSVRGFSLQVDPGNTYTRFSIYKGVAQGDTNWLSSAKFGYLPIGEWSFLTATFKRPFLRTYLNGLLIQTSVYDYDMMVATSTFQIGRSAWRPGDYLNEVIDEVRIYSTALTSAEIQQHYAEGLFRHLLANNPNNQ